MPKKRIIVGLCFATVVCVIALLIINATYVKVTHVQTTRNIYARNLSELQDVSDIIVRARVLPDKKHMLYESGYGITITQMQIESVFKGSVSEGEIIEVLEEYRIRNDGFGKTMVVQGGYVPAKEKQSYILFLTKYEVCDLWEGMYGIIDLEYGKYKVSDKITPNNVHALSENSIEVREKSMDWRQNQYRDWYKKVMELYVHE